MNLNKVALYLEYIAFVLRKEGDSQVSKDKKNEANPHNINTEPRGGMGDSTATFASEKTNPATTLPAGYERASSQLEDASPPTNGVTSSGPSQLKAPPIKKAWSSPIQAMARIEQEMNGLDMKQRKILFAWFAATYGDFPAGEARHPSDPANVVVKPLGGQ